MLIERKLSMQFAWQPATTPTDLILRSREAARLEGWAAGEIVASWFETALVRLLTMRVLGHRAANGTCRPAEG